MSCCYHTGQLIAVHLGCCAGGEAPFGCKVAEVRLFRSWQFIDERSSLERVSICFLCLPTGGLAIQAVTSAPLCPLGHCVASIRLRPAHVTFCTTVVGSSEVIDPLVEPLPDSARKALAIGDDWIGNGGAF